jgi:4-hydroxy-3-polyprenylbenzoate decarboxylase
MLYKNLQQFISVLEKEGELIRIKEFVNPELEICELTDRFSKQSGGGKALLFENTGTGFPVLTNAMGSLHRICLALGADNLDSYGVEINDLLKMAMGDKNSWFEKLKILPQLKRISSWMPEKTNRRGECQEIIINNPDLSILPILKCWPADGGRFVTLPLVHTIDPVTGIRNLGMYRMQVFDKNLTGMHWHRHKTGARHYAEYKKMGKRMPVAVALGGDPAYTWSATAPLPDQIDEYILAGFIRKKKVELVKCITQDIYVPYDVDIVIEGYVDPMEELIWEGPFGDHTGFYSLEDWYPKFHVTCITHRKNAVYPATIVGIPPQEDAWIARATERFFLTPIKLSMAPEIIDLDIPPAGTAHNLTILKIEKTYPGQGQKVMNSLWGAGQMMFNKFMVTVDGDVDIHNYPELFKHICKNLQVSSDLLFGKGPLDVLDHSSDNFAYGSKLGIDVTHKFLEEKVDDIIPPVVHCQPDITILKEINPGIENMIFPEEEVLLFSVKSTHLHHVKEISTALSLDASLQKVKLIVAYEASVELTDFYQCTWQAFSNTDPARDCMVINSGSRTVLCCDATFKTKQRNNFKRLWPNAVVSDSETIDSIDKNWSKYTTLPFIASPSRYYQNLKRGNGAVATENIP